MILENARNAAEDYSSMTDSMDGMNNACSVLLFFTWIQYMTIR